MENKNLTLTVDEIRMIRLALASHVFGASKQTENNIMNLMSKLHKVLDRQ